MFESLFKRIKSSDFLKNVATLMTGSVLSQVIALFTAPILTRIYKPEDYGMLGIYMSVSAVFGVFATLMYDQAIIVARTHEDAGQLVRSIVKVTLLVTALSFLTVFLFKDVFANWLQAPNAAHWFLLVPLSVLFGGITAIFGSWSNRFKKYKRLASTRVSVGIISVIVSMSLGLLINGPLGLIVALLVHQGCMALFLLLLSLRYDKEHFDSGSKSRGKKLLFEYRNFPKFAVFSELINRVANQLPVYILSATKGEQYVGHYNMSNRILGLPINFISSALTEVFRQKASEDYTTKGNCKDIYVKTMRTLFMVALLPFTLVAIFAPDIFGFVFGENWRPAGMYSRPLSILFFFKFVASPLSYVYYIAGKQRLDSLVHIWIILSSCLAFYAGQVIFNDIMGMLYLFSINYAIIYIFYLVSSYKFCQNPTFTN